MTTEPELPILYQDAHVIAVDKPAWSVVHGSRGVREARIITRELAAMLGAPAHPCHRLDRQTSGVLLFARSSEAAASLGVEFREERVRKSYLALCRGVLLDEVTIDHPVLEGGVRRPARTDVEPLEVLCGRYTLVRGRPRSGRKHQLRCHLKHVGHPIVGDTSYGKGDINRFFRDSFGLTRMFLHAESLRVLHPFELRMLELVAPLPAELDSVLVALRAWRGTVT